MAAHKLSDVTVVADAGMISQANQEAIEAAGLSFILGSKIPTVPYLVDQWRKQHPGQDIPYGHVFTQRRPANAKEREQGRRDKVIYYQYRADRARRSLRGIDEQVAKAEKAVAGKTPVKRNRFVTLSASWRNGVTAALQPSFVFGYSRSSAAATVRSSASACVLFTPGFSFPTARRL